MSVCCVHDRINCSGNVIFQMNEHSRLSNCTFCFFMAKICRSAARSWGHNNADTKIMTLSFATQLNQTFSENKPCRWNVFFQNCDIFLFPLCCIFWNYVAVSTTYRLNSTLKCTELWHCWHRVCWREFTWVHVSVFTYWGPSARGKLLPLATQRPWFVLFSPLYF